MHGATKLAWALVCIRISFKCHIKCRRGVMIQEKPLVLGAGISTLQSMGGSLSLSGAPFATRSLS
jgi:hypothetical protein